MNRVWTLILVLIPASANAGELVLSAPLEPATFADVHAGAPGEVRVVAVQEGDRVAAGDTLALLDDVELRLSEASRLAEYRQLGAQLERAERMRERGLISAAGFESTRCDVEAARIRWVRAVLALSRAVVLSPMSGLVVRCELQPGGYASAGRRLFRVIAPEDLKVELYVPADRVGGIRPGHLVTAQSDLHPDLSLPGHVLRISPVVDPASETCRVIALFPKAGARVRPGTVVRVSIDTACPTTNPGDRKGDPPNPEEGKE